MVNLILAKLPTLLLFIYAPEQEGQKDSLLSINPGLIIWTIIIFILLILLLKKLAWKPLITALNNRENLIKDSVQKAEQMRNDADRLLQENKRILEKAEDESRKIINEGRQLSEKLREEMVMKTQDDTSKMIKQAKSEIEREKISALNDLKSEIASLAIGAAEKIIDENLDEQKQKKIVDKFIQQIPKN